MKYLINRAQLHKSQLLTELDDLLEYDGGAIAPAGALLVEALAEVCNPRAGDGDTRRFWLPYLAGELALSDFFADWLGGHPASANPGYFLDYWYELTATRAGQRLADDNVEFGSWFERFLDALCSVDRPTQSPLVSADYSAPTMRFAALN